MHVNTNMIALKSKTTRSDITYRVKRDRHTIILIYYVCTWYIWLVMV